MTFCGSDCCRDCPRLSECGGCEKCGGHPFGGDCVAAKLVLEHGPEAYLREKAELIESINSLGIPDLQVNDLYLLNGAYVNLVYPLPNGSSVRFLKDNNVYFGNQIEIPGQDRCYGVIADPSFILIAEYGCNGADPELILFRRRQHRP